MRLLLLLLLLPAVQATFVDVPDLVMTDEVPIHFQSTDPTWTYAWSLNGANNNFVGVEPNTIRTVGAPVPGVYDWNMVVLFPNGTTIVESGSLQVVDVDDALAYQFQDLQTRLAILETTDANVVEVQGLLGDMSSLLADMQVVMEGRDTQWETQHSQQEALLARSEGASANAYTAALVGTIAVFAVIIVGMIGGFIMVRQRQRLDDAMVVLLAAAATLGITTESKEFRDAEDIIDGQSFLAMFKREKPVESAEN